MTWSRALERSLCYAYGCWEVLEQRRPRPIDLIVGRSTGLGSSLFAPVYWPAAPVVNFLDYYYHAHRHDLADEAGPDDPAGLLSLAAVDGRDRSPGPGADRAGLDAHATGSATCSRPSTVTTFLVLHDGVDTRRFARFVVARRRHAARGRSPAGSSRTKPASSVSWPGRSTASAGSTGS